MNFRKHVYVKEWIFLKRNDYTALLLIAIGLYFFITQFDHPIIDRLHTWSTLVIAVGIGCLFAYMKKKNPSFLIQGFTITFIGFHLYALEYIPGWNNHWAMYPLMWGLALLITYVFTRKYLYASFGFIIFSLLFIFSHKLPDWFPSVTPIENEIATHWPLILIGLGIILYVYKRK